MSQFEDRDFDMVVEQDVDVQRGTDVAATEAPSDESSAHVLLILRDGLDLPMAGLELFVTLSSGQLCTALTTDQGAITVPLPPEPTGQAKVEVTDAIGKRQHVCTLDLARCENAVIIRSPKVKADLLLRVHQQTPPSPRPAKVAIATTSGPKKIAPHTSAVWWGDNGALDHAWTWLAELLGIDEHPPASLPANPVVLKTLSKTGQPVSIVVGPEGPNKDNLRMGRNNVFRQIILDAAKRLGLIPQALCALIDCEAGKVSEQVPKLRPDGKPLTNKAGTPLFVTIRERWDPTVGNAQSGAAGLTQFLRSTWLAHVLRPGFYIHEQSKTKGWVRQEPQKSGKLRKALQMLPVVKPKMRWVFVLSNGTSTTGPSNHLGDANVQQCLAMRLDAAWSINAAADYGYANLKVLVEQGFKMVGLTDMDKAKLMYLLHHEGEGAGPLFIRNKLRDRKDGVGGLARLRVVFAKQFGLNGEKKANEMIDDAGGDVEVAYRLWLATYIDKNFDKTDGYFFSEPRRAAALSKLLKYIGGSEVATL